MQITNITNTQQELLLEALSRLYVKYDRSSAYWETKAANAKYVVEAEHCRACAAWFSGRKNEIDALATRILEETPPAEKKAGQEVKPRERKQ